VFLDVGAHVGMVSLSVASRCRSRDVEVHSFEPHPVNAAALRRNAELNPGLRVTVNAVAVGDREGTVTLDPSPLPGESGWHGLAVGDRATGPADGADLRPEVPVVSLDGYIGERGIERVDVLKVDVEGWEPAVLAGAQQALARGAIRSVVAEANRERLEGYGFEPDAIERELERHGLRPVAIPGAGLQRLRRRRPGIDYAFALPDSASTAR
jgi:FkbM family methyltransferase